MCFKRGLLKTLTERRNALMREKPLKAVKPPSHHVFEAEEQTEAVITRRKHFRSQQLSN